MHPRASYWLADFRLRNPYRRAHTVRGRSTTRSFFRAGNLAVVLVLVVVRIAIDDQHFIIVALYRLLARMRQQLGRVQFLDRNASSTFGNELHLIFSCRAPRG